MGRKVFLSFLGANYYDKAKYYFEGDKSKFYETHFIQEATLRYYLDKGIKFHKVYIFLTQEAKKRNWSHPAQQNNFKNKEPYDGLEYIIKNLNLDYDTDTDIPDGKNEQELWEIFQIVYSKFEKQDEVYLDITHSFRSLPIFLTVLMNYAKTLKNVTVAKITYGNWEARDNQNFAPVIDLTAVNELQNWTIAANNFVKFGNSILLAELTKKEVHPILRETKGRNETARKLRDFSESIEQFYKDIVTNRLPVFYAGELAKKLKIFIREIRDKALPALAPLIDEVESKLDNLDSQDDIINGFRTVKWALDNDLIQQAYSLLRESIITYILKHSFPDEFEQLKHNAQKRELVSSAFKIIIKNIPYSDWLPEAKHNKEFVEKIINDNYPIELIREFDRLGEFRNDIMHAGMRYPWHKSDKLISVIKDAFNKIVEILNLNL